MNEDNFLLYTGIILVVFSLIGNSYIICKTFNSIDFLSGLCLWCFESILVVSMLFIIKQFKDL